MAYIYNSCKYCHSKKIQLILQLGQLRNFGQSLETEDDCKVFLERARHVPEIRSKLLDLVDEINEAVPEEEYDLESADKIEHLCAVLCCLVNSVRADLGARRYARLPRVFRSLPHVSPPLFSGKCKDWPEFKASFEKLIHNNEDLSKQDKMRYLMGCVRGEAIQFVKGVNPVAANYQFLWQSINAAYRNRRVMADWCFKDLLSMRTHEEENVYTLDQFLEKFHSKVQFLNELCIPDLADYMLFYLAYTKLPEETQKIFDQTFRSTEFSSYAEIIDFVQLQKRRCLKMTRKPVPPPPAQAQPVAVVAPQNAPGRQLVLAQVTFCFLCPHARHHLGACPIFLNMSPSERWAVVRQHKRCPSCLKYHGRKSCGGRNVCTECQRHHHPLLHQDTIYDTDDYDDDIIMAMAPTNGMNAIEEAGPNNRAERAGETEATGIIVSTEEAEVENPNEAAGVYDPVEEAEIAEQTGQTEIDKQDEGKKTAGGTQPAKPIQTASNKKVASHDPVFATRSQNAILFGQTYKTSGTHPPKIADRTQTVEITEINQSAEPIQTARNPKVASHDPVFATRSRNKTVSSVTHKFGRPQPAKKADKTQKVEKTKITKSAEPIQTASKPRVAGHDPVFATRSQNKTVSGETQPPKKTDRTHTIEKTKIPQSAEPIQTACEPKVASHDPVFATRSQNATIFGETYKTDATQLPENADTTQIFQMTTITQSVEPIQTACEPKVASHDPVFATRSQNATIFGETYKTDATQPPFIPDTTQTVQMTTITQSVEPVQTACEPKVASHDPVFATRSQNATIFGDTYETDATQLPENADRTQTVEITKITQSVEPIQTACEPKVASHDPVFATRSQNATVSGETQPPKNAGESQTVPTTKITQSVEPFQTASNSKVASHDPVFATRSQNTTATGETQEIGASQPFFIPDTTQTVEMTKITQSPEPIQTASNMKVASHDPVFAIRSKNATVSGETQPPKNADETQTVPTTKISQSAEPIQTANNLKVASHDPVFATRSQNAISSGENYATGATQPPENDDTTQTVEMTKITQSVEPVQTACEPKVASHDPVFATRSQNATIFDETYKTDATQPPFIPDRTQTVQMTTITQSAEPLQTASKPRVAGHDPVFATRSQNAISSGENYATGATQPPENDDRTQTVEMTKISQSAEPLQTASKPRLAGHDPVFAIRSQNPTVSGETQQAKKAVGTQTVEIPKITQSVEPFQTASNMKVASHDPVFAIRSQNATACSESQQAQKAERTQTVPTTKTTLSVEPIQTASNSKVASHDPVFATRSQNATVSSESKEIGASQPFFIPDTTQTVEITKITQTAEPIQTANNLKVASHDPVFAIRSQNATATGETQETGANQPPENADRTQTGQITTITQSGEPIHTASHLKVASHDPVFATRTQNATATGETQPSKTAVETQTVPTTKITQSVEPFQTASNSKVASHDPVFATRSQNATVSSETQEISASQPPLVPDRTQTVEVTKITQSPEPIQTASNMKVASHDPVFAIRSKNATVSGETQPPKNADETQTVPTTKITQSVEPFQTASNSKVACHDPVFATRSQNATVSSETQDIGASQPSLIPDRTQSAEPVQTVSNMKVASHDPVFATRSQNATTFGDTYKTDATQPPFIPDRTQTVQMTTITQSAERIQTTSNMKVASHDPVFAIRSKSATVSGETQETGANQPPENADRTQTVQITTITQSAEPIHTASHSKVASHDPVFATRSQNATATGETQPSKTAVETQTVPTTKITQSAESIQTASNKKVASHDPVFAIRSKNATVSEETQETGATQSPENADRTQIFQRTTITQSAEPIQTANNLKVASHDPVFATRSQNPISSGETYATGATQPPENADRTQTVEITKISQSAEPIHTASSSKVASHDPVFATRSQNKTVSGETSKSGASEPPKKGKASQPAKKTSAPQGAKKPNSSQGAKKANSTQSTKKPSASQGAKKGNATQTVQITTITQSAKSIKTASSLKVASHDPVFATRSQTSTVSGETHETCGAQRSQTAVGTQTVKVTTITQSAEPVQTASHLKVASHDPVFATRSQNATVSGETQETNATQSPENADRTQTVQITTITQSAEPVQTVSNMKVASHDPVFATRSQNTTVSGETHESCGIQRTQTAVGTQTVKVTTITQSAEPVQTASHLKVASHDPVFAIRSKNATVSEETQETAAAQPPKKTDTTQTVQITTITQSAEPIQTASSLKVASHDPVFATRSQTSTVSGETHETVGTRRTHTAVGTQTVQVTTITQPAEPIQTASNSKVASHDPVFATRSQNTTVSEETEGNSNSSGAAGPAPSFSLPKETPLYPNLINNLFENSGLTNCQIGPDESNLLLNFENLVIHKKSDDSKNKGKNKKKETAPEPKSTIIVRKLSMEIKEIDGK